MGPDQFTDNSDRVGLFEPEVEPYTYLTVHNIKSRETPEDFPSIIFVLSDTRRISERSAFNVMMLLGELGGLYGALVGIPSYFISSFVQISFMSAIA